MLPRLHASRDGGALDKCLRGLGGSAAALPTDMLWVGDSQTHNLLFSFMRWLDRGEREPFDVDVNGGWIVRTGTYGKAHFALRARNC